MILSIEETLTELIKTSSFYGQEGAIGTVLEEMLSKMGFRVEKQEVQEGRYNILAQKGQGKSLLLFGHMDTIEKKSGWNSNPLLLSQKGDRLYGLGAWDMKGGIAAILTALEGFEPKGFCLKVAFVVDEENYSLGMHTLIQSGWLNDVVGAISPEPGFQYGLQGIALGRIGRSVYTITITTEGGHVYLAGKRTNAITEAAKIIQLLRKTKTYTHPQLGESFLFPRFIHGGTQSMMIPDSVTLELETQLVPPQTSGMVFKELQSLLQTAMREGQINAQCIIAPVSRPTPFCDPYLIDEKNDFVTYASEILFKTLHKKPIYYYRRSVADENRVAALGIPVLTIGSEGGNAHEINEWVSAKSLRDLTMFLRNFLNSRNNL